MSENYRRIETKSSGPLHVYRPPDHTPDHGVFVFVHGFNHGSRRKWYVDYAWDEFRLQEKFTESGSQAMLVAVEARQNRSDKIRWSSLPKLTDALQAEGYIVDGPVHAIGHSAAYVQILKWLDGLTHVTLLDGLYGSVGAYRSYVESGSDANIDLFASRGGDPHKNSAKLVSYLDAYHVWQKLPDLGTHLDTSQVLYAPISGVPHMDWVINSPAITLAAARAQAIREAKQPPGH